MPKVGGKHRVCIYCDKPQAKYFYNGRFKGYRKTCEDHHGYKYRKGENNSAWKGGRLLSKDGYVLVLHPERYHKKGISRYMLEHRLVMERKIGRKLESNEIVHHLNGIRTDNRIENLVLINGPFGHETWTYPKQLQNRIRELEVLLHAQG